MSQHNSAPDCLEHCPLLSVHNLDIVDNCPGSSAGSLQVPNGRRLIVRRCVSQVLAREPDIAARSEAGLSKLQVLIDEVKRLVPLSGSDQDGTINWPVPTFESNLYNAHIINVEYDVQPIQREYQFGALVRRLAEQPTDGSQDIVHRYEARIKEDGEFVTFYAKEDWQAQQEAGYFIELGRLTPPRVDELLGILACFAQADRVQ